MKRAFVHLCLGLLWVGSTSCDSQGREYGLAMSGGESASSKVGTAGADAAAGSAAAGFSASSVGGSTANTPSSSSLVSDAGQVTTEGGATSDAGEPSSDAGVVDSGEAGADDSSTGAPLDRDTGSGDDGDSGSGTGSDLAAARNFCSAYFEGICEQRLACGADCTSPGGYQRAPIECQDALASLEQGLLTYNADSAAECLSGFVVGSCGPGGGLGNVACTRVFAGTVDLGGECAAAEFASIFDECATGFCRRALDQTTRRYECLGTCASYAAVGETCEQDSTANIRCAAGLVCIDSECAEPGGIDANCESVPCQPGLVCADVAPITCRDPGPLHSTCLDSGDCDHPAVCVNSECVVGVPDGAYCRSDDSCASGFCPSDICVPLVAPGAACGDYDRCATDYICAIDEQAQQQLCLLEKGGENEACGPWGACETGLWCTEGDWRLGQCVQQVGAGEDCPRPEACGSDMRCMSNGKCYPRGQQGEPCLATAVIETCAAGFFCDPATGLCDAPRAEGESCNSQVSSAAHSCQDGLYCECVGVDCPLPETAHPEDVCVPQLADGVSCAANAECVSGHCSETCGPAPEPVNCSR